MPNENEKHDFDLVLCRLSARVVWSADPGSRPANVFESTQREYSHAEPALAGVVGYRVASNRIVLRNPIPTSKIAIAADQFSASEATWSAPKLL